MRARFLSLVTGLSLMSLSAHVFGQAECNGWGEFRGIRVEGELVPFSTSIKILDAEGKATAFSATQTVANPQFSRTGDTQTSSGTIGGGVLTYRQTVQDVSAGTVKVTVNVVANRAMAGGGVYYYVTLPADLFSGGDAEVVREGVDGGSAGVALDDAAAGKLYAAVSGRTVRVTSPKKTHSVVLDLNGSRDVKILRDRLVDTDYVLQEGLRLPVDPKSLDRIAVRFPLASGDMPAGQQGSATFTISAKCIPDTRPVSLMLDLAHPVLNSRFDGIGGNFRIQNPTLDPIHLNYNLENLRVAWGRVEMPLPLWQPQENMDPAAGPPATASAPAANPGGRGRGGRGGAGGLANTGVQQAMQMARTLAEKKIPFVISAWSAPQWAYAATQTRKPDQPAGIQALRLNPEKTQALYKAIGSYLIYLKEHFGAEPVAFSWNEPDLGINVLFTPQEHADWIAGLGKYLESQGLKTKMVLADACSTHPVKYIDAAMENAECRKYIAAVSFHSWHDGTPEEFAAWGAAARKLGVPLLCGEGGTDSDAYRYPQIFAEPWFGLYELQTYLQMMQYGQLTSVLHWQLTENYSVLTGGGGGTPVVPTRRFYHLKQLDLTPVGAACLPVVGKGANLTTVAYGDAEKGTLGIHLLNSGAARECNVSGIPQNFKELRVFVTDQSRQVQEMEKLPVSNGGAKITLDAGAYFTLLGSR